MTMRVKIPNATSVPHQHGLLLSAYVIAEHARHVARMQAVGAKPLKIGQFHFLIEELLHDDVMMNLVNLSNQEPLL
jgi:hypothetical protein